MRLEFALRVRLTLGETYKRALSPEARDWFALYLEHRLMPRLFPCSNMHDKDKDIGGRVHHLTSGSLDIFRVCTGSGN